MLADHPEADAVVVLIPHFKHAEVTVDSLRAGFHVLVEKPMALQVRDALEMVRAAEQNDRLLAVNFQQRFRPEIRQARALLMTGALGQLQRMILIVTWPRSRKYYQMAAWRATWQGEGGGVLMNQAPHDLDLVCYLMGLPAQVVSWNRTAYHQIEVEDTVSAMLEWTEGATGYIHISTQESDLSGQLTLVGTGGVMRIEPGKLQFSRFEQDVHVFLEDAEPFARSEPHPVTIELPASVGDHAAVHANFRAAVRGEEALMCSGAEGMQSLMLANAMTLSSYRNAAVSLPLDPEEYAFVLAELQSHGKQLR